MVRPAGFEPATSASAGQRSIHLSYGRDKQEHEKGRRTGRGWRSGGLTPARSPGSAGPRSNGGERGIRTPGTFYRTHDFQSCTFSLSVISPRNRIVAGKEMAEREGFEPPRLSPNGFQDRRLRPLGHLSARRTGRPHEKARPGPPRRPGGLQPRSRREFFLAFLPLWVKRRDARGTHQVRSTSASRAGTSAAGTRTEPSGCWLFSRIAASVRPTARPEPFSVCTKRGFPFSSAR